jgi:hypothetical protein
VADTSDIEREIEQTRENLATTIDQLIYRVNPKTIASREVNQVKGYFVDQTGAPRTDNITKVAVGAAGVLVFMLVIRKIVR